jgi:16S rRNA (adenine1518-N6/adenine1519-N6)-dimethyltransferase
MKLKKSLGQHFLIDTDLASSIAGLIKPFEKNTTLLEIGPGNGALTEHLVNVPVTKYLIIELDSYWKKIIEKRYTAQHPHIEIREENILDTRLAKNQCYTVIGNIPYNITFPILKKIISLRSCITKAVLMTQEEVAQKLVAQRGSSYGPISVLMQTFFTIKLSHKVPPAAFCPPPKVTSRVFVLEKKATEIKEEELNNFSQFLGKIFRLPRKKIKNQGLPEHVLLSFDEEIQEKRAQELSPEKLYTLFKQTRGIKKT